MAKRALNKDLFREIRKTRSRFVSILLLVVIAVCFLFGLRMASPDMKASMDSYLDQQQLMDVHVSSNMGLTQEDIDVLAQTEGTQSVEGFYTVDALATGVDRQDTLVVKAISLSDTGLNAPYVTQGRLPQAADECLVEDDLLVSMGLDLGDQITFDTGTGDYEDSLPTTPFTIVGVGESPLYISLTRGTSTLGNGSVEAVVTLTPEAYQMDSFTDLYIQVEGASALNAYEDAYEDLVESYTDQLEELRPQREEARTEEIRAEAQAEIDDAWAEYYDAKAEADQELEDARIELEDARLELDDGWEEYDQGILDLDDAWQQIADGRQELADAKDSLEEGEADYNDGKDQYDSGKQAYEDGLAQYEDGYRQYVAALAEYAAGLEQYQDALAEYTQGKAGYDEGIAKYQAAEDAYAEGLALYEEKEAEYDQNYALYESHQESYDQQLADYQAQEEQYAQKLEEYQAEEAQYALDLETYEAEEAAYPQDVAQYQEDENQYALDLAEYQQDEASYASLQPQYEADKNAYEQDLLQYQAQEAEYKTLLDRYQPKEEAYQAAQNELEDLEAQWEKDRQALDELRRKLIEEDGLSEAEADLQLADAEQELTDQKEALETKRAQLEEQWTDLLPEKTHLEELEEELKEAKADLDKRLEDLEAVEAFRAQLDQTKADLTDRRTQLDERCTALKEKREELDQTPAVLEATRTQLDETQQVLAATRTQLDQHQVQLEATQTGLEEIKAGLEDGRVQLDETKATFEATRGKLDENKQILDATGVQLAQGKPLLDATKQELDQGKAVLDATGAQLRDSKGTLDASSTQLDEALAQLQDARKELDEGWEEYWSGLEDLDQAEQDAQEGQQELADALAELNDGEQEYADGLVEYEDGKAEAEQELADARQEIADGQEEVDNLEDTEWYILDRTSNTGFASYQQDSQRMTQLATVFPTVFFLVAALVCLTTMTRMVEEQRVEIGSLKALGYSKLDIARKYVGYGLMASLIGGVIGLVLGAIGIPWVIVSCWKVMYNFPGVTLTFSWPTALVCLLAAVACCTVAVLVAALAALRATPASLMRPRAPQPGKRVLLEHIPFLWSRMSFSQKVTARNLFRYKKRLFMTVIGIAGCTGLMVSGFGLRDSIMDVVDIQFGEISPYSAILYTEEDMTDAEMEDLTQALDGESDLSGYAPCYLTTVTLEGNDYTLDGNLLAVEDPALLDGFWTFRDRITQEPVPLTDQGALISEKTAELMNLSVGDSITVVEDNRRAQIPVAGIMENYVQHYVFLTKEVYAQAFGETPADEQILLSYPDSADWASIGSRLLEQDSVLGIYYLKESQEMIRSQLDGVYPAITIIILSAAALAFVVLYNLSSINITERLRELATLKVLGFRDREMRNYVFRENAVLTLLGMFFGVIAGKWFHSYLITTVEVELVMFGREAHLLSYVLAVALTILFALLVNLAAGGRLRKIDMVESLKTVE